MLSLYRLPLVCLVAALLVGVPAERGRALEPIPEKLVVLTFDDSVKSHYTVVRPILQKYGFRATFFITEGFDFKTNKTDYMTWAEIAELHRAGFEIGNHTRDHLGIDDEHVNELAEQLEAIAQRCREHDIPVPVSFAWPGNATSQKAFDIMREQGIRFARRGGAPEYDYESGRGFAYEPGFDHPLLVPSAGDARPDWELEDLERAVSQAREGRIAVLQFHGVPDRAHPWVHTPREKFEQYMHYLATNGYRCIALGDLAQYVDPAIAPQDPQGIVRDRQAQVAADRRLDNARRPSSDAELEFWLENMLGPHHYTLVEAAAATGMTTEELKAAAERLGIERGVDTRLADQLLVLPYPGGRHPRTGFRDGALRPQRETKLSIFAPWSDGGYAVADIPEAIWWQPASGRELLYLAHTHVPTKWDREGIQLEPLEWQRSGNRWIVERKLPNGVAFGAAAEPRANLVELELWIRNDSPETLRGLMVQNCVMLAGMPGFDGLTNDNKLIRDPFVACRNTDGTRWIITAWQRCQRPWGNAPCPCMHSDPQFPDCAPGETQRLRGLVAFYEGTDIDAELEKLRTALE